jgi:hypothetical protein
MFERLLVDRVCACDDPGDVYDRFVDFYSEGPHFPESYEEAENIERSFLNSLDA